LIPGIGEKTIKDIERIYLTEDELVKALISNLVPLRDDVVRELRKFYGIQ